MPSAKPQRQIDWEAVWKSLNWDDEQRQQSLDQERLRQRAQHYAAPVKEQDTPLEDAHLVLTFELGAEKYGIDVKHVRGIRIPSAVARVPGAPPFYRGVINVRGQIITVMDLRVFFQIPHAEDDAPAEVVIVESGALELALLAHQVLGVNTIPAADIKLIDHMPYAYGLTSDRSVLLNINQLFSDERLIVGGVNE